MKIRFLGTSHGVPSATRFCSSCCIEIGESLYFIDAGAPVADLMFRYGLNYNNIRALFNTHFHGDHIFGAVDLLSLSDWYFKQASFTTWLPEPKAPDQLRELISLADGADFDDRRLPIRAYGPDFRYDDGKLSLSVVHNHHLGEKGNAYSFRIEAEGKKLFFTGDMSGSLEDFPKSLTEEHFDLVVTENAHCSPENLISKLEKVDAERIVVSHIYPVEKNIAVLTEKASRLSCPLRIAEDGDVIDF